MVMKKRKFSESQIITALEENESGGSVEQIRRELEINKGAFVALPIIDARSMER